MMSLEDLKQELEQKLKKQLIPSSVLLSNFVLFDDKARKSSIYQDPIHFPFYYYLGQLLDCKNLLEIGSDLGFCSSLFLKGNQKVEKLQLFQEKTDDFYSFNICIKNIKKNYKKALQEYYGNLDVNFFETLLNDSFDVILLNKTFNYEKMKSVLDYLWTKLSLNGILVVDNLSDEIVLKAFVDFAKIKNRSYIDIKTRYKIGLIRK